MVIADFQAIIVALTLLERQVDGRYPPRQESQASWLLPMAETVRQVIIRVAIERGIDIVTTNSDGLPARRAHLLSRLGPGATETIIDPGWDIVTERLTGRDGVLSDQCVEARDRWYSRRA